MKQQKSMFNKIKVMALVMLIVTTVIIAYTVFHSGVIPTLDKEADVIKKESFAAFQKEKLYEGMILDKYGEELTVKSDKGIDAECKYPLAYGWIIGYNSPVYGKTGLRSSYEKYLWNSEGNQERGATIKLTIDTEKQLIAYDVLNEFSKDGSIIVLENNSGRILTFVSRSPVELNNNDPKAFNEKGNKIEGAMFQRGLQSKAPGSTFKLVTAAAGLDTVKSRDDYDKLYYYDTGVYTTSTGYNIHNYGNYSYGMLNLKNALKYSSNTYFANLANEVGYRQLKKTASAFMIGKDLQLDFTTLKSNLGLEHNDDSLAATGFGQGSLAISELHLATIGSSFINGEMMKPYLIEEIKLDDEIQYKTKKEVLSKPVSKDVAKEVTRAARYTAKSYGFEEEEYGKLAAKSGTAELPNGETQSYLLAYDNKHTYLISAHDVSTSLDLYEPMQKLLQKMK